MSELTAERFGEFFDALWGRRPFAWQAALAKRVAHASSDPWPEAIALPTASGKTVCLDIAVFALASQAGRLAAGEPLAAPRRVFFVVDRRVIVDEAYERARQLALKLRQAESGILKVAADALRALAGNDEPLAVFELRGGMYRSEAWARSPVQPTIICSTVDQLGSRLLFRAYGPGPGMRPILAGLTGNDALILLDEAHCAVPFLETLQAVRKYRGFAQAPLVNPFRVVVMSATPPGGVADVFRDDSAEPRDPAHPLGRRQLVRKPARLVLTKASGKTAPMNLANVMAIEAQKLADAAPTAVVVFANRVATAREAHRRLAEKHGGRAVLLTGRMRAIDRDDTVRAKLDQLNSAQSEQRSLAESIFVVATQTLEVGADLDFDALVTECASLDALRQRFGRLNRMGRPIETRAVVLVRADQTDPDGKEGDDAVYGAALSQTWRWLKAQAGAHDEVDFGIAAMGERFPKDAHERSERLALLSAPAPSAPVMLPAHVDCWAQTAPEPMPSPDVALFLRGQGSAPGDIRVCWRADVDLSDEARQSASIDVLTLVPPSSAETLPVPIWIFQRWLAGHDEKDFSGDLEGGSAQPAGDAQGRERKAIRWRGRGVGEGKTCVSAKPRDFRPGDVAVIPADEQGWNALGDLVAREDGTPVFDWGDRAHAQTRAKAALRLHPGVVREYPDVSARARLLSLVETGAETFDADPDGLLDDFRLALVELAGQTSVGAPWLSRVAAHLARPASRTRLTPHPLGGFLLTSRKPLLADIEDPDSFSDEDDASSSGTVRVPLDSHLRGVADYAKHFATGAGLPAGLAAAVESAGQLHDLGKADPRFQALLRGGVPWVGGELLAKSGALPQGLAAFRKARDAAGYPEGGRHELLSVRLAESLPGLLPADAHLRDLVLHLVASHHGHCRPFAPVVFDEKPIDVRFEFEGRQLVHSSVTGLERLDSGVADRFWRLVRRYGWWGLAWLEAILRLADHRRSEAEERNTDEGGDKQ